MIDQTPCPDAATLFRLRTGKIPDPLAAQLRDHLAHCPACARSPSGVATGGHRLKAVHGAGGATATAAPANGFLRPPEQQGELGRLGDYRVLRLMGEDGSGSVYEAEHLREGVRVALQVVAARGPAAQRVMQGADAAYEVGEDNDALFLATELPGAQPTVQLTRGPRYCPRCLADLRELGGKEWCAKCGYSSDEEYEMSRPARPAKVAVPYWLLLLLGGCVGVVVATVFRRQLVPAGSAAQVWWILIEAGAGLLLYAVGHVLVVVLTFRHWRDGELFKYIDPMTAAKYAIEYLPRTRWGICLAAWGAVAFLCAFVLFWMNDFAFKDKRAKRVNVVHGLITTGDGETVAEDPEAGDFTIYSDAMPAPTTENIRDLNTIDAYGDPDPPERQEPPNVVTCVVVGYVPDPNDPNRVAQLVLGSRGEDGTIRYVGAVGNFARTDDVNQGVAQVKGLKPLLERPGYLPAGLNVIPVEPAMTARIGYQERDAQGLLKNAAVKGIATSAGATP